MRRAISIVVAFGFLAGVLATGAMIGGCGCWVGFEAENDHACCSRDSQSNDSEPPAPTGQEGGGMICDSLCCCTVVAAMFDPPLPSSPGMVGTIDTLSGSLSFLSSPPASPPPRAFS